MLLNFALPPRDPYGYNGTLLSWWLAFLLHKNPMPTLLPLEGDAPSASGSSGLKFLKPEICGKLICRVYSVGCIGIS